MQTIALVAAFTSMSVVATPLIAQEQGIRAAEANPARKSLPPWYGKIEMGRAEIHVHGAEGSWLAIRLGRRLDESGYAWLDLGFTRAGADGGFGTLELGIELQPLPRAVVTPFLGLGGGILGESEFTGTMGRASLGVDARLQRNISLRVGIQGASHGGEPGPNVIFGGCEVRAGGG